MGFYGNITNTSNTTFSFDRIYPNRLAMDANANNDGIFIGRYVLVEYQEKAAYPVAYHATLVNGSNTQYYFYSSTNQEEISKIKYLGPAPDEPEHLPSVDDVNAIYQDGFYKGEILQYYIYSSEKKDWIFSEDFYKCVGGISGYAIFEKIETPEMKSDYIQNFEIDENHYGQNSKGFKGYDSTVWVKSSVEQSGKLITKYVSIADLNSVVPTFDIAADAPTMNPITPHFDADSTNVYYKLHAQPQWGFRIAQTSADKSDETTQWIKDFYDPVTDTSSKKYASGITNGIPNWDSENPVDLNAAIYFNEAGFKKQLIGTDERNGEIKKHSKTVTENTIKIEATGKSGNEYNTHNGKEGPTKTQQIDTQEITINLPAIGNMMSDAWDIIHGPDRDDYKGQWKDENESIDYSSLQGRLNALSDLQVDEIPVKRLRDGQIIGSKINGGKSEQEIYGSLDDAWIQTLVDGNTNTISIHHTFNSNKNGNPYSDIRNKEMPGNDTDNNINLNDGTNTLDINTPIIDATGHVVGKNIETVTLPYGYKHFKTDGLSPKDKEGKDIVGDLYSTVNYISTEDIKTTDDIANSSVAHNTQDILTINPHNKWIQTKIEDTENDGDILTIAHEIHSIDERYDSNTNLNDLSIDKENEEGNLTIYDWDYDEAGHINKKREHTYTLPYGFKTINVGNNNTESAAPAQTGVAGETADNTQDSLTFEATNKWIKMAAVGEDKENKITFGHELSDVITTDKELTNLNAEITKSDSIVIPDWSYDAAGHIISKQKHEYILPYGYKSFTDGTNISIANSTQDRFNLVGDDWLQPIVANDTITYKHIGPVKPEIVNDKNNIENPQFGSIFIIEDWHFDNKGHMHTSGKTHTVQFPKGSIEHPIATSNNSEIITSLSFVPESGKISYQKDNSSTLKLTTDYTNNGIGAGNIAGGDSLNTAFAKLEKQIMQEANTRATDILKEASDRDTAIKTAIANLVDSAPDNINTLGEIVAWLDNDGDEKIDIIKDIAKNASDISNEVSRATDAEGTLQEKIDILQSWKDTATQDIADLNNIISQMQITIQDLQKQIGDLKNPPQEPDNGGETV